MRRVPAYLYVPSTTVVEPPIETTAQLLPFEQLQWEDFERLCLRLAEREGDPEHCQLYGERGQAQGGIDVYARLPGTADYIVYQSRRVKRVTPARIKKVVDDFLGGEWRDRASKLVFCTSFSLTATKLANAVEEQAARLSRMGKSFVAWDRDGLSRQLKDIPRLVHDFFGRVWVERFCGPEAAAEYEQRLDVEQVHELRQELHRFYSNVFARHDAGAVLAVGEPEPPSLAERFVVPDVIERREVAAVG